ncbi:MAG TPA: mannose-6-phosphate isomerase, class I [Chitinophagaceae bacterium]
MTGIARLTGTVKHYDWGGMDFIPFLLQIKNDAKKPFAEYWLGVHPLADCRIETGNGEQKLLRDSIRENKEASLGSYVNKKFGDLPYLLKIMDVKDMLSIQVHPSKADAEKGFAEENAAGIPLTSPKRNYKDANHKPELIAALNDFWLLHGFKPADQLSKVLDTIPELNELKTAFGNNNYEGLYRKVMMMPQPEVNRLLQPLLDRIIPLYQTNKLHKTQEDFWAARAALTFSKGSAIDRGIFSVYFFNILLLKKGEAIFQDAGIPHAYLEGTGVEIMSNSDNVLRGGLTPKHVDVNELLKHVKCEATLFSILKPGNDHEKETIYTTPAPDFELSCIQLDKGITYTITSSTAEIFILTKGKASLSATANLIELYPGNPAAIVFAGVQAQLTGIENTTVFRATVPIHSGE